MLIDWGHWPAFFDAALLGAAQPWLICLALVLMSFLLEDVAIAAGAALAVQALLSWELALLAVGGGIVLGDVGLYGLGWAARSVPALRRRLVDGRAGWLGGKLARRYAGAIVLARVVPGLRLVTYTACGFYRLPFALFCIWVVLAVAVWTGGLMGLSAWIGTALRQALGIPPALAVALPIVLLALVLMLWRRGERKPVSAGAKRALRSMERG
jgi:membrane protein DedA with SNARE-associated domain